MDISWDRIHVRLRVAISYNVLGAPKPAVKDTVDSIFGGLDADLGT